MPLWWISGNNELNPTSVIYNLVLKSLLKSNNNLFFFGIALFDPKSINGIPFLLLDWVKSPNGLSVYRISPYPDGLNYELNIINFIYLYC